MLNKNLVIGILISLSYLVIGLFTLPHYGINWDTINHSPRGQSYLNYFLTGSKDFSNLPKFQTYWQQENTLKYAPDIEVPRVSLYHNAGVDFNYFVNNDGGHPPLSDILSAFFNYVLFQKLGITNDIDSYRVYGIVLASLLVGFIYWWTSSLYGKVSGFFAALTLATYPLFWSESHFNVEKDIPEAAFITFFLFCVWKAVNTWSVRWVFLASLFFGLALGTKFNAVFVPLIIVPWLTYYALKNGWIENNRKIFKQRKKFILFSIFAPLISLAIFIGSWPYLWADPIARIQSVVGFYKGIGLTTTFDERYLIAGGFNTYPVIWIYFTTAIPVLVLFLLGASYGIKQLRKEKHAVLALFGLWIVVTVGRVVWPGTSIYGGVRQIMEYVPVLSIFAGIGAKVIFNFAKSKFKLSPVVLFSILLLFFVPHLFRLITIHPNENVYFNEIAGGLQGARESDLLFWGNSFGAAYRQGAIWLNENAPQDSKITYARELIPNIPRIWLRRDVVLHNGNRSGYLRQGEYIIALTYDDTEKTSYHDRYLDRFLYPVYEVKVDDVPILKIWKNDTEHSRNEFLKDQQLTDYEVVKIEHGIRFQFKETIRLSRIEYTFDQSNCLPLVSGYVLISSDGSDWLRLPGTMPKEDWSVPKLGDYPLEDKILVPFAADEASHVDVVLSPKESCPQKIKSHKVFYFK